MPHSIYTATFSDYNVVVFQVSSGISVLKMCK